MLLKSDFFYPYIIVPHFYNGTKTTIEEAVEETFQFFIKKGYEVYKDYDWEKGKFLGLSDLGKPDLIFHLSPYNFAFPDEMNICNFPLFTLNINVPYGIYVAELSETQYNLDSFSMYWKIFDLPFYCQIASKYTKLGNFNRVPSGYCKLDAFYEHIDKQKYEKTYWKGSPENIRIVYAPHHSIGESCQQFSTFDKNYDLIYEFARRLPHTSWVFKPHPLLKKASVEAGVFNDEREYEQYEEKWNQLPNGKVITGGDYFPLFQTSDCMILDSDSFLAEYQYVHKPILLLTRDTQKFSDLGIPLSKTLYRAEGNDINAIDIFLTEIVRQGKDRLKEEREIFFDNYLNYYKENGKSASEYIFSYLSKKIYLSEGGSHAQ